MPSIIRQRPSERTCGKCERRTLARLSSGQRVKDKFSPTYTKVESRTGDFTAMTRQFSQSTPSIAGSIWSRRGNGSRCAISFHNRSTRSTSRRWNTTFIVSEIMFEIPSVSGNINASTKDVCFTFVPNQINSHSIAGSITYWIVEAIDLSFR